MGHHHEALIETLDKMANAGVELRELAFAENDYLALAAEVGINDPAASLVMTRWRSVPAEQLLECVGCSSRLSYHALERLTSMGAHDIDHNCKTGELRLRLRDKSESKGLAAYLKSVVDRGEFFQFAKPLTDSEHRKQDLREWEKKNRATREDGPGIARLPEPRPEPLAFLDEDLLCDDE